MSFARYPRLNGLLLRRFSVIVALIVLVPLAWLCSLDNMATQYVDSGLTRALATFAVARTANAAISIVQETTVAVSPGGMGFTTSPGQILDPLNDLVEQFSTLMLAACISLGMQRILISIGSLAAVSLCLTVTLAAWAWFAFRATQLPHWLTRVLVLLLFVRFAVPLAALGSEATFLAVMSTQYEEAQSQVKLSTDPISTVEGGADVTPPAGVLDLVTKWFKSKKDALKTDFGNLRAKAENTVNHIITLMALFILQTAVLPLLFLWLVYKFFGATFSWRRAASP